MPHSQYHPYRSHRLEKDKCILFLCDIQNKFAEKTYGYEGVISSVQAMIKAAKILGIPVIITQSNTKQYSQTIPRLVKHLNEVQNPFIFKQSFSMLVPRVQQLLSLHKQRSQVVLVGMETHVCILQTFLDLKQRNYLVHTPVDAITSLRSFQRTVGIKRLQKQGAIITTVQTVLFELLKSSKNQYFRDIMHIIDKFDRSKSIQHL